MQVFWQASLCFAQTSPEVYRPRSAPVIRVKQPKTYSWKWRHCDLPNLRQLLDQQHIVTSHNSL